MISIFTHTRLKMGRFNRSSSFAATVDYPAPAFPVTFVRRYMKTHAKKMIVSDML